MEVLRRDDLRLGGFAGLREHRLVTDPKAWGPHGEPGAWAGLGNFVYLADARFMPRGETGLHPHREIDVISVMVEGRIAHGGTLEDGEMLVAPAAQVQRGGGEGFLHNEVNPDDTWNRMIQMWVLPDTPNQPTAYRLYELQPGERRRIYGGAEDQDQALPARTSIDVALVQPGESVKAEGPFMAYLTRGGGVVDGRQVGDGDLLRGEDLEFTADSESQLILVQTLG